MSRLTKNQRIKELERKVAVLMTMFGSLNTWTEYADDMLTALNDALPDPEYDAKCEAQEADIDASLDRHRERLGLNKPQLKQLDQSVFPLIERDTAKEQLEVDLSSELTGSELCRAMLARGDKYILCLVGDGGDYRVANQGYASIVIGVHSNGEFDTPVYMWEFAVPINNQGEPLTAKDVGL